MWHGKEVVTSCTSEKALREELIDWYDYDCYYQRRCAPLNLNKLKPVENKKQIQFEKSTLKRFIN